MDQTSPDRWWPKPLLLSLASGILLWAAFPPLGIAPLAWGALVPVLLLIYDQPRPDRRRRWYLLVWLVSSLHWLLLTQGIRLSHWSTYFGWLPLGLYLGIYLPLFIGLTRVAVHCCRWPLMLAAPLTWTGLELVRGHALSGFSMGLLAHTQVHFTTLIQLSDLVGAYGVSFLVVLVNAALAAGLVAQPGSRPHGRLLVAVLAVVLATSYGWLRGEPSAAGDQARSVKIALLQGVIDTTYDHDPTERQRMAETYQQLSVDASQEHPDLIVWPESMFPYGPEYFPDDPATLHIEREKFELQKRNFQRAVEYLLDLVNESESGGEVPEPGTHLILGTGVQHVDQPSRPYYNAALWIQPDGTVGGRYYKSHLVTFGEYVPLGDRFPWLYRLMPFPEGVTPGTRPSSFTINGVRISPSICFESTVPHFMRRQVSTLTAQGLPPDMMINITNDGWFWGSSVLDLHLACSVFRAVELRLPMLIAANTGFSAVIDSQGKISQQGPRREPAVLFQSVQVGAIRFSLYRYTGDLFGIGAALVCLVLAGIGWRERRAIRRQE
jgi:apolipoprotein N-acyltransferase